MSLAATKEPSGFDPAALALRRLRHIVLRNQHVIGVSHAENFHAHQPKRNYHRVAAIHSDRVDRLQPSKTLTPLVAEGHVAPDFLDRAPRLHPTKHRAFCQRLILERHFGLTQDSCLLQPSLDPAPFTTRCEARWPRSVVSPFRFFRIRHL